MANICVNCARTVRECEWLARLKPVPGWMATLKKYKEDSKGRSRGYTYHITQCPNFAKIEERAPTMIMCVCKNCGKTFYRKGRAYKYCSYHCMREAAEKRYWERL